MRGTAALSWAWILVLVPVAGCGDDTDVGPHGRSDGGDIDGGSGGTDAFQDAGETRDSGSDAGVPGDPERFLPTVSGGARIKARVAQAEGAPPVFLGWYDEMLDVACEFTTASDGALRCLPLFPAGHVSGDLSMTCDGSSRVAIRTFPECELGRFALTGERRMGECFERLAVVPLSELAEPPESHFSGSPDFCDGPRPNAGRAVLAYGDPLPVEGFVSATERIVMTEDGIGVSLLEAEDGARLVYRTHDVDLGLCGQRNVVGGVEACAPFETAPVGGLNLYSDDACTVEATIIVEDPCRDAPSVAEIFDLMPPIEPSVLRELAGPVDPVYRSTGAMCEVATDAPPERSVFAVLPNPPSLRPLTVTPVGTGALRTLVKRTESGILLLPGQVIPTAGRSFTEAFFVDEADVRCRPYRFGSGLRCAPVESTLEGFVAYADAACTIPLLYPQGSRPASGAPTVGLVLGDNACEPSSGSVQGVRLRVLESAWMVDGPYTGPAYRERDGSCRLFRMEAAEGTVRVGAEITSSLPELVESLL